MGAVNGSSSRRDCSECVDALASRVTGHEGHQEPHETVSQKPSHRSCPTEAGSPPLDFTAPQPARQQRRMAQRRMFPRRLSQR